MKIIKAGMLAIIAVLELARDRDVLLSAEEIASRYGVSFHHLAKVMRTLVHANLVQAVRGAGGGYRFSGNAGRTTLLDVIQLFELPESKLDTLENSGGALPIVSELKRIVTEIDDLSSAVLDTITLETALKMARQRSGAGLPDERLDASTPGGDFTFLAARVADYGSRPSAFRKELRSSRPSAVQ